MAAIKGQVCYCHAGLQAALRPGPINNRPQVANLPHSLINHLDVVIELLRLGGPR